MQACIEHFVTPAFLLGTSPCASDTEAALWLGLTVHACHLGRLRQEDEEFTRGHLSSNSGETLPLKTNKREWRITPGLHKPLGKL